MQTLRASEIFRNARLMLVAVQSVEFRHGCANTGCQVFGSIEPIAVVVCGLDAIYALDMKAKPIPLEQLSADVPGLDALLTAFRQA